MGGFLIFNFPLQAKLKAKDGAGTKSWVENSTPKCGSRFLHKRASTHAYPPPSPHFPLLRFSLRPILRFLVVADMNAMDLLAFPFDFTNTQWGG